MAEGDLTLEDVLETVGEFGEASVELVAWELWSTPQALAEAWAWSLGEGLTRPGAVNELGEPTVTLTAAGAARVAFAHVATARVATAQGPTALDPADGQPAATDAWLPSYS